MEQYSFGYWLRLRRKALDLTREGLADRVGYSAETIRKIETEQRRPSAEMAERLAEILNVPQDERTAFLRFARGDWRSVPAEIKEDAPWRVSTKSPRSNLPATFTSLNILPHNLPIQLTSFIGREHEIAEIKELLTHTRLLTLTGPGGTGKTRLSLQVAAEVLDTFPDGVWLVELAPLSDPALVPQAVALVWNLREQPGRSPVDALIDYLRAKSLLLILDNCEHLITACAQLADVLLTHCGNLKILATSREALGITGERVYQVPTLPLPKSEASMQPNMLFEYAGIQLFVERAVAVKSDFRLAGQNAAAVVEICQQLDGIPLAIELAAARTRMLTAEQIAERLNDRFHLLTQGSRTALPRQQTLRAAMDWSYDLLREESRILFQRLSVFVGGFTLETVEEVCSAKPLAPRDILDLLGGLVDRSLVTMERQGGAERYRLLETIRANAREKLNESGEGQVLNRRHLEYFTNWAEEVEPKLRGAEQLVYQKQLETEHDNLRAALDWAADQDVEAGLRLASVLAWFWDMSGYWKEGLERLTTLLNRPQAMDKTLACANALFAAGLIADAQGDYKASREYLDRAIAIAREQGQAGKRLLAFALCLISRALFNENYRLAQSLYDEGWVIAQELADQWLIARMLYERGYWLMGQRDYDTVHALFEKSRSLFHSLGDRRWESLVSRLIAQVDFYRRDYDAARLEYEQGLAFCYETKDRLGIWSTLNALGEIARVQGNYALAKEYYLQCSSIAQELGGRSQLATTAGNLGFTVLREGKLAQAQRLFAEVLRLDRERGLKSDWAFWGFACLAAIQKRMVRATKLLAAARSQQSRLDAISWSPADQAEVDYYLGLIHAELDEASFNAAWAEGQKMTLEQAIEYALKEAQV